jgi:hypothetical protein
MKPETESVDTDLIARVELVRAIETLQTDGERRGPGLQRVAAAATARRQAAEAAFRAALEEEAMALRPLAALGNQIQLHIADAQNQLRESAPHAIDDAISMWWGIFDQHRGHAAPALMIAIKAAHELKLQALTCEELELRLAALRSSIPIAHA